MTEQPTPERTREALLIYCDAIDSATTQLRRNLGAQPFKSASEARPLKKEEKKLPSGDELKWEPMQPTAKGPWEKCSGPSDSIVFQTMVKLLKQKNMRPGQHHLYWLNTDGSLGRRAFKQKA
jgi:hypothetical protein